MLFFELGYTFLDECIKTFSLLYRALAEDKILETCEDS